jgi:NAD(P)-dependent dehydrogenase (short-subunit alcohol dehydrogenase family)
MAENGRLQDKIVMITGATAGIGEVTAHNLAAMGADLILVARNEEKAKALQADIQEQTGKQPAYMLADLSNLSQIRQLAGQFQDKYDHLDVLVNNAGAVFLSRQESVDGFELTLATNHLNYFLLTNLLLDSLKASEKARIVNVASDAHRGNVINFDDLNSKQSYATMRVYGQSKLANIMFTYELARRLDGTQVTANSLHPGFVRTNFGRNNGWLSRLIMPVIQLAGITKEKGAETMTYLASSPEVEGVNGKYFEKKTAVSSSKVSYDEAAQKRLWDVSAEMVGL